MGTFFSIHNLNDEFEYVTFLSLVVKVSHFPILGKTSLNCSLRQCPQNDFTQILSVKSTASSSLATFQNNLCSNIICIILGTLYGTFSDKTNWTGFLYGTFIWLILDSIARSIVIVSG